jgi:hypothetical protein
METKEEKVTDTGEEKTTLKESAEDLVQHAGEYLDTLYKKTAITLTEKGVKIGASVISGAIAFILGFFVLFFAGLGLGWWVGNLVNSRAGGFFIIAGFYAVLIMIVILAGKKTIIPLLRNMLIRRIYD